MEHLIANSGIQFLSREVEFNPSEPLILENNKTLKYNFCETEEETNGLRIFDLLYYDDRDCKLIPLEELRQAPNALLYRQNGREVIDEMGMVMINPDIDTMLLTAYSADDIDGEELFTVNSPQWLRVKNPADGYSSIPAFELMLDRWLPMPMYKEEIDGITADEPMGWCRMKISKIGDGSKKGTFRYRIIWAFDTELSSDGMSELRPYIEEGERSQKYRLCNKADSLIRFMSSSRDFHPFSDYIASILGIDLENEKSLRFKAYYIYFINFIRLLPNAAPEVTLHAQRNSIPVDLVLDIGNSRTCGILFEEGLFTNGTMLALTDLTSPNIQYENKTFDMRIVFRKADFGNDIVLEEPLFAWKSFVRVGEEARRLVYKSIEEVGLSERTTNYSSPKRYLWDERPFDGHWENLVTTDDAYNVRFSSDIYVDTLSELFTDDGKFVGDPTKIDLLGGLNLTENNDKFSRSSLMTFAMIEIFMQAITQINSIKYREKRGDVDCKRELRNVIITCPTAMPMAEQIKLRQAAQDAFQALAYCTPGLKMVNLVPSPAGLKSKNEEKAKEWAYDEASCSQLVYLYAEIAKRYNGEIRKFFDLKGHVRKELVEEGYEDKALTIGTVDIGAGTTDIMVCAYECEGDTQTKVSPIPLFWDSFYVAGDDILRNLVQNVVIEGRDNELPNVGNITSALTARIIAMDNAQLQEMPCAKDNVVYQQKIYDITATYDPNEIRKKKIAFASNLVHDFFGADSAMMGYKDRHCRTDFNTQISVPIAQKMMDLLRRRLPSKLYTYEEIFPDIKPSSYLLDNFAHHFGFRFEDLNWRYDPDEISGIVKSTMEPLMKQLALVLYYQHCDMIVLAGRPTSLDAITELFIKYLPASPDRIVRLNDYRVGSWFPTADGQGYFYDQKAIVAVGGMVGFLGSHGGLDGLVIDFKKMTKRMHSTAEFIGEYNCRRQQVAQEIISPTESTGNIFVTSFPAYIGTRQLNSSSYQARPLYAIYNKSKRNALRIILSRNYYEDKEVITVEEVVDSEGNSLGRKAIECIPQSLADDGNYWLDKGEFELTIK